MIRFLRFREPYKRAPRYLKPRLYKWNGLWYCCMDQPDGTRLLSVGCSTPNEAYRSRTWF